MAVRSLDDAQSGTGACVTSLVDRPTLDAQMRIPCCAAVLRDTWELEALISTAASCYGWFRNNFARDRSFAELDRLAADPDEPAAEKFLPYLSGGSSPHWGNPSRAFPGLALNTDVGRLARAVLEGVSYTIRENLEVMRKLGVRAEALKLFGGGAKSALWCQITADIANMPVETPQSAETAVAGAAMLAFHAVDGAMRIPCPPRCGLNRARAMSGDTARNTWSMRKDTGGVFRPNLHVCAYCQ